MNAYICMCVSDIIIQAELSQCCEGSKVKNILTVDCRTVSMCVCMWVTQQTYQGCECMLKNVVTKF